MTRLTRRGEFLALVAAGIALWTILGTAYTIGQSWKEERCASQEC